jgi:hypothetical protein
MSFYSPESASWQFRDLGNLLQFVQDLSAMIVMGTMMSVNHAGHQTSTITVAHVIKVDFLAAPHLISSPDLLLFNFLLFSVLKYRLEKRKSADAKRFLEKVNQFHRRSEPNAGLLNLEEQFCKGKEVKGECIFSSDVRDNKRFVQNLLVT